MIFPGSSSRKASSFSAWRAASTRSVVRASSGRYGRVWKLVIRLSRPNSVMNHGSPAAGRLPSPTVSENRRNAARSVRLEW